MGYVIHAASVGEVIAATPLVKRIQKEYPNLPITFTTVTPTGSERVKAAFGESVTHCYLPYDLPCVINRFIDFIQPKVFIVIETELWPNLIDCLAHRNIPFIVAMHAFLHVQLDAMAKSNNTCSICFLKSA